MYRISRRQMLAGGAATFVLTACGSGESQDKKQEDLSDNRVGAIDNYGVGDQFKATEPVTFSIMVLSNPGYPYKDDWLFWKELAERTNVTFESTVVPLSDYNQKRSVLINGGDAPLIIPKTYHPDEEQYVAGGAVLPVSDYLDLMPHFQDKAKGWNMKADLDTLRQNDGKFYLLPGMHEDVWKDYSLAVRTDILDEVGMEVPETWDDVRNMLAAMKEAHPDSYPLSARWDNATGPGGNCLLNILSEAYGTRAGWGYQNAHWDRSAKKFVFAGAMDEYRQLVQYLNTLVREKLLDPESFTRSIDQNLQNFAAGKAFVIPTNASTLVTEYRKNIQDISGATVNKIPVPIGPTGAIKRGSRLENGVMISSDALKSENFVAMMQLVDWLWYSPEGKMFAKWGIEGKTYTGSIEDGTFELASNVDWAGLNPDADKNLQVDYGFFNGVFTYGGSTEFLATQFTEEEQEFQKVMNQRKNLKVPPPHPLTDLEQEKAALWETALTDHVSQQTLKFILGQRPLSDWDAYVKELEGKNMTQYIDMVNKAYERFQKKYG